jgi:uncharacterized membrane protein YeaQ/YmgE (transglycosylase-associated protein family)
MLLHIIGWIIAGIIAGFIASKLVNKTGEGLFLDLVLGVVGGFVGGWLIDFFFPKYHVEGGLNIPSIIVAIIGGVVFLVVYHAIRRRV